MLVCKIPVNNQWFRDEGSFPSLLPTISESAKPGFYVFPYIVSTAGIGSQKEEIENRLVTLYVVYGGTIPQYSIEQEKKVGDAVDQLIIKFQKNADVASSAQVDEWQGFFQEAGFIQDGRVDCGQEDINKDGAVDIVDLVMVGRRFGEMGTFPRWVSEDVNGDGKVDIIDLVLVAREFGNSCVAGAGGSRVSQYGDVGHPTDDRHPTPGFASILKSIFWVGVR